MSESSELSNHVFDRRRGPAFGRRTRVPPQLNRAVRRNRPDDDPPPSPARAAIPVRRVVVMASSIRSPLVRTASCRPMARC